MFCLRRLLITRLGCLYSYMSMSTKQNIYLDWEYYCNPLNHPEIIKNAERRRAGKIKEKTLQELSEFATNSNFRDSISKELNPELKNCLFWFPNKTHIKVSENLTDYPILLEKIGKKPRFDYTPATFDNMTKFLNLCRTRYLGHITGTKSYFLKSDLARLERALVKYTLDRLIKRNFTLVSVPDIVHKSAIEACGMKTQGEHTQIFHIDENWGEDLCLSGTAEIALGAFVANKTFSYENLPLKLCSVSRCYRAEAKKAQTEKGIFRVHSFTKVEMFGLTSAENGDQESENLMAEFIEIQKSLFSELGLCFNVLEMPMCELGLPAYHKVDMETWFPGRKFFGEISSTSNCTDFQCRRLNTTYVSPMLMQNKFCHSVNGTACAVPRMLIAIFENFQNLNGSVNIPLPLQPYFRKDVISGKFPEILKCTKPSG